MEPEEGWEVVWDWEIEKGWEPIKVLYPEFCYPSWAKGEGCLVSPGWIIVTSVGVYAAVGVFWAALASQRQSSSAPVGAFHTQRYLRNGNRFV